MPRKHLPIFVLALILLLGMAAAEESSSPIFGVTIPDGYRQWEVIAPSHDENTGELRAILGNSAAMKAYWDGTLPFPDGSVLAKLSWKRVPSSEFLGGFVPGAVTSVQFMVKDAKRYASTGGWGFGRFIDRKPDTEELHRACFPCHQANVKAHGLRLHAVRALTLTGC